MRITVRNKVAALGWLRRHLADARQLFANHPLAIWRAGLLVAGLSLALGVVAWRGHSPRKSASLTMLEQARERADVSARQRGPTATFVRNFALNLPPRVEAEQLVQRLAASSLLHAVALTDSRIQPAQAASELELQRATLTVNLRGSYPGIKATLADTLARTENATLQSLNMRREGKSDLDTHVVLSVWLRPASAAGRP